MTQGTDTVNLGALFLEHAGGKFTERALRERRDRILTAITNKIIQPTQEVLEELAEINISLGEAG